MGLTKLAITEGDWLEGDESDELQGKVILGRATIDVDGGGRFHGLVVCRPQRFDTRWVVYWERTPDGRGVFRCVPLT